MDHHPQTSPPTPTPFLTPPPLCQTLPPPPPCPPPISDLSHCHHTLEVLNWVVVSTLASETQLVLATPSMMVRAPPPPPPHPTPPHPISRTQTDREAHM